MDKKDQALPKARQNAARCPASTGVSQDIRGSSFGKQENQKIILERFLDGRRTYWGRLGYALRGETYRHSRLEDVIYRVLIISNRV
jgi:hypothetical protein